MKYLKIIFLIFVLIMSNCFSIITHASSNLHTAPDGTIYDIIFLPCDGIPIDPPEYDNVIYCVGISVGNIGFDSSDFLNGYSDNDLLIKLNSNGTVRSYIRYKEFYNPTSGLSTLRTSSNKGVYYYNGSSWVNIVGCNFSMFEYVPAVNESSLNLDIVVNSGVKLMDFVNIILIKILEQPVLLFLFSSVFVYVVHRILICLKRTVRT